MNRRMVWFGVLLGSLFLSVCAPAQWQSVAPGIDYQEFSASGPNNLYVARLDRSEPTCTIDSCIAQGQFVGLRETVRNMANRYDDTIGYWGQSWGARQDVVVAINGDFWDTVNLTPQSGQIISGWYAKRFTNVTGGSGFAWTLNRVPFIGGCVSHTNDKQKVAYPRTGQDQNFQGINVARGSDQLILYTPHRGDNTGTDNSGSEVLVELSRPLLIIPLSNYVSGTVKEVRVGQGSTVIPFDHVVLSAHGAAASKLVANVAVEDEVRISQEIRHYEKDCATSRPFDWTKTYASIGSSFHFLKEGVIQSTSDPGLTNHRARTAIAFNDSYVFFLVVDEIAGSVGMNMAELGDFCLNTVAAVEAVNQDGGGSSTLWLDGEVKNNPTDGSERATYNGMMMVSVQEKSQSSAFAANDNVEAPAGATLRLGPGTNYGVVGTISPGAQGSIVAHPLGGVLAKGQNWWKCDFGSAQGWALEGSLTQVASGAARWEAYR